jgi:hypothetical protein
MSHPTVKSTPAWTFPGRTNGGKTPDHPGPGAYTATSTIHQQGKTLKFGRSQRGRLVNNVETPGPGAYAVDSPRRAGPSFSILGKTRSEKSLHNKSTDGLGPGAYDPKNAVLDTSLAYSFATKSRKKLEEAVPGPGAYDYRSSLSRNGVRIGTAPKERRYHSEGPGPGRFGSPGVVGREGPKYGFGTSNRQRTASLNRSL